MTEYDEDRSTTVEDSEDNQPSKWWVRAGNLTGNLKFVLSIFLILVAISLLYQVTAGRADASNIKQLLEQGEEQRAALQEQADLIIDCTSPGGKCYEEGQQRTAKVVAGLNVVSQYSVICGERENGEEAILACVNQEVEQFLRMQEKQEKQASKNN